MWFLHAIYTVRSAMSSSIKGKRSTHHSFHTSFTSAAYLDRTKRAVEDTRGIGDSGKGTNMARIILSKTLPKDDPDLGMFEVQHNTQDDSHSLIPILLGILIFFVISLIIVVIVVRRRKKHSSPPPSPTNTITVISKSGKTKVVQLSPNGSVPSDRTEV